MVMLELLKHCTDDYASEIHRRIRDEVIQNVSECVNVEEEGFTKGDVALAIGRVLLSHL